MDKKEKKRLYDIEYRKNNQEKIIAKNKNWYESSRKVKFTEDPQHYLWYVARTRSRQKGTEFTISKEDVIIPEFCPILNIVLSKGDGYLPNAMSLDRVDNDKGYIPGNVRVISRRANLMKSSLTLDVLEKLIKYIKKEI
tara:strand:- start:26 stop:442 length:417 start_codon:yes stop_codon:yes gene_type:complete